MDIFILGSCVTRDIFRVVAKGTVVDYYASTSLVSLMSKPLSIQKINLKSEFQKKIVRRDFEKDFFEILNKTKFDVLIIDLIDERFGLLKYADSYVTRSTEFVNAGLDKAYSFQTLNRYSDDVDKLWKSAAGQFVNRLQSLIPPAKIILHEAYWADKYKDHNEIKPFEDDKQRQVMRHNAILSKYYHYIRKLLPVKTIRAETATADAQHLWGLTPFHYTNEYYFEVFNQLQQHVGVV